MTETLVHRGDWLQCMSCGEESIFFGRDWLDFICSVCGCHAFIVEFHKRHNGKNSYTTQKQRVEVVL